MKKLITLSFFLLLLSSCKEIKVLRVGILNKPYSLQSWKIRDGVSTLIGNQIHRGLIRIDPSSGATIPSVAKSWDISKEKGKITFTLDETARFTDGTKITCNDVMYSFQRITTHQIETSFILPKDINFNCEDNSNFVIKTKLIPALLFDLLASPSAAISKEDGITGAGPYRIKKQNENEILLEKAKGKGPVLISFQIGNHEYLVNKFKKNEIDDLIYLGLFLDIKEQNCEYLEGLAPTVFWFGINSRAQTFKSLENRKTIQKLLNLGIEVSKIFSNENRVKGLMPYGMSIERNVSSVDDLNIRLKNEYSKAIKIISKFGKIDFYLRETQKESFNWKSLFDNIDSNRKLFNIKFLNNSDFFDVYYNKSAPIFLIGANITRNDPFEVLSFFRKHDFINPSGVSLDLIDKLMLKSSNAINYEEIKKNAKEASDWIIENGYAIPLFSKRYKGCFSKKINGYQLSPLGPLTIDYSLIEKNK